MAGTKISQSDYVQSPSSFAEKETDSTLQSFRQQIDAIDRELLALLDQRCGIVQQVGEYKRERSEHPVYLRPGREADMVRQLAESAGKGRFSAHAAALIWRQIISASTSLEAPVTIGLLEEGLERVAARTLASLTREHFGPFSPQHSYSETTLLLQDIQKRRRMLGIFPAITRENGYCPWWWSLADHNLRQPEISLYVFLKLPFLQTDWNAKESAYAVGYIRPEPTRDDTSLFVIRSRQPLLNNLPPGVTLLAGD
jgi:chorismate mutase